MYSFWAEHYWRAIHILAILYDPNSNVETVNAAKCFYISLSKLLPGKTNQYSMQRFIQDNPIDNFLSSSERLFYWTWMFHNYIRKIQGKDQFPLESASALYNKSTLNKSDWGSCIWFILHFTARNMPDEIPQNLVTSYKALMVCLQYLLPCERCRKHLAVNLVKLHIDDYVWSKSSLFLWTVNLHNTVNKSINKPYISVENAWNIYNP